MMMMMMMTSIQQQWADVSLQMEHKKLKNVTNKMCTNIAINARLKY